MTEKTYKITYKAEVTVGNTRGVKLILQNKEESINLSGFSEFLLSLKHGDLVSISKEKE